jgi:molybdate transport system substrate-binding protein
MPCRRAARLAAIAALLLALDAVPARAAADVADPIVFAAASLKNALDDAAAIYEQKTGKHVILNYAGSSTLAKQIEQAAPADIFFSADIDWMDYLQKRGLIDEDSRATLLGNSIVLVAPKESAAAIEIKPGMPLTDLLGSDGHLAMANVDSVPAGIYGKAALTHLGAWDAVADKVVLADNVRAALAFVASGEAPLGIVYATDAAAEPAVRIVGEFPADSHPPILYPVALTTASEGRPSAAAFLDFLKAGEARQAFERQGFALVGPESPH